MPLRSGWIGDGRVGIGWHRSIEDAVTVVDPVTDEAVREHENRFLRERVANHRQTTQLEKNRNDIAVRCSPHQQLTVQDDPEAPDASK